MNDGTEICGQTRVDPLWFQYLCGGELYLLCVLHYRVIALKKVYTGFNALVPYVRLNIHTADNRVTRHPYR